MLIQNRLLVGGLSNVEFSSLLPLSRLDCNSNSRLVREQESRPCVSVCDCVAGVWFLHTAMNSKQGRHPTSNDAADRAYVNDSTVWTIRTCLWFWNREAASNVEPCYVLKGCAREDKVWRDWWVGIFEA